MKINVDFIYPIGSVYISTQPVNPSVLFGGEWVQTCKSRCLVGAGSNIANTDTTYGSLNAGTINFSAGALLGVPTVTLTTSQMPSHTHTVNKPSDNIAGSGSAIGGEFVVDKDTGSTTSRRTQPTGGGQAHSNMPPAEVYYIWKRVS